MILLDLSLQDKLAFRSRFGECSSNPVVTGGCVYNVDVARVTLRPSPPRLVLEKCWMVAHHWIPVCHWEHSGSWSHTPIMIIPWPHAPLGNHAEGIETRSRIRFWMFVMLSYVRLPHLLCVLLWLPITKHKSKSIAYSAYPTILDYLHCNGLIPLTESNIRRLLVLRCYRFILLMESNIQSIWERKDMEFSCWSMMNSSCSKVVWKTKWKKS